MVVKAQTGRNKESSRLPIVCLKLFLLRNSMQDGGNYLWHQYLDDWFFEPQVVALKVLPKDPCSQLLF